MNPTNENYKQAWLKYIQGQVDRYIVALQTDDYRLQDIIRRQLKIEGVWKS